LNNYNTAKWSAPYRRALSFDQETAKKSPVRLELVRAVDLQKRAGPIIIRFLTITLKALANSSPGFAWVQKWLKELRLREMNACSQGCQSATGLELANAFSVVHKLIALGNGVLTQGLPALGSAKAFANAKLTNYPKDAGQPYERCPLLSCQD
jgi:hypothetical protein